MSIKRCCNDFLNSLRRFFQIAIRLVVPFICDQFLLFQFLFVCIDAAMLCKLFSFGTYCNPYFHVKINDTTAQSGNRTSESNLTAVITHLRASSDHQINRMKELR